MVVVSQCRRSRAEAAKGRYDGARADVTCDEWGKGRLLAVRFPMF